jgi:hypothetical protein
MQKDNSTYFVATYRIWQMLAGGVTLLIIPYWLTEREQGYYFAFGSVVGLQIFFELGFTQIILQKIGAIYSKYLILKKDNNNLIQFEDSKKIFNDLEVISFFRFFRKWYLWASFAFFCIGAICGVGFFINFSDSDDIWGSIPILISLLFFVSLILYQSCILVVFEACGQIKRIAWIRIVQSVLGYALLWIGIAIIPSLWWMVAPPAVASLVAAGWFYREKRSANSLLRTMSLASNSKPVAWRQTIWPLQWRIALSWGAGYLMTQLFVPVIFAIYGAEKAGQFGMTLALFSAVFTIAHSWIAAKTPKFVHLIALNLHPQAFLLFQRQITLMLSIAALGCLSLIFLRWFPLWQSFTFMHRVSEMPIFLVLACTTMLNCFVSACAVYMRAHQGEPMLWISMTQAFLTIIALSFTQMISLFDLVLVQVLLCTLIIFPWTVILFQKYHPSRFSNSGSIL